MIDVSSLSPDLMADLTRLPRYIRLSETVVVTRDRLSAIPGGGLIAAIDSPDGPATVSFSPEDLAHAAESGFLAASDDPLYLVSKGDWVEFTDGAHAVYTSPYTGIRSGNVPPLSDPHAEAAETVRDHCRTHGVRAISINPPDSPSGESPLIRENTLSPELPWICPLCPPARQPDKPMDLSSLRMAADLTIQWYPWTPDDIACAAMPGPLPHPDDDRR